MAAAGIYHADPLLGMLRPQYRERKSHCPISHCPVSLSEPMRSDDISDMTSSGHDVITELQLWIKRPLFLNVGRYIFIS